MGAVRSLTYLGAGQLAWRERSAPVLQGSGEALVRPLAASICDIDLPLLRGTSPWQGPFALGHEAVAEVVDVGDGVVDVVPGDRVAVSWHINCGTCDRCIRGRTAYCRQVPDGAMYGLPTGGDWGGLFDDLVRVPFAHAMLTRVAPRVSTVDAVSAGDNLSLGYSVMEPAIGGGARTVLVLGSASVGIAQVAFAVTLGALRVVYVDDDAGRRAVAESLGALAVPGPPDRSLGTFDLVVDAAFDPGWLRRAVRMTEPKGVVECVGGYFDDVSLPLFAMYTRGVQFRTGRADNGPHIGPTVAMLAAGAVRPSAWSTTFPWDEAPERLLEGHLKPVAVRDPRDPTA
jgi:threonine dehydrogenase-like Zn-dependent dehydrogenase